MLRRLGGALSSAGRAFLPKAPSTVRVVQFEGFVQYAAAPRNLLVGACRGHAGFAAQGILGSASTAARPAGGLPGAVWGAAGVRGYAAVKKRQNPGIKRPKKTKLRFPSSMKERFKVTGTGLFLRMRVGKRHCAFAKSTPQRRRLRQKALVPVGLAKTMRKLSFTFAGSGRLT